MSLETLDWYDGMPKEATKHNFFYVLLKENVNFGRKRHIKKIN